MQIKLKMNLSILLFLIGILGFILNRKNIILMIIAIEIMLLAVTLLVLISSYGFDDNVGQTFSIYIISIAGAESVIGLSILVAYYRLRGTISLKTINVFRNNSITNIRFYSIRIIRKKSRSNRFTHSNMWKFNSMFYFNKCSIFMK